MNTTRRIDSLLNLLWLHSLALAGGASRRYQFEDWPASYRAKAKA
jgi:hypothetical protein